MLRSQRVMFMAGVLLLACFLHVKLCDWKLKEQLPFAVENGATHNEHETILVWKHAQPTGTEWVRPGFTPNAYTGIVTQSRVDLAHAVVFGVALPVALLMLLMYLCLGWRRDTRVAHGMCAACGYDLRGTELVDDRCPECGAVAQNHLAARDSTEAPHPDSSQ